MKKNFPMKCVAALAMLLLPLPMLFVFEVSAFGGFTLWHYLLYYAGAGITAGTAYFLMSLKLSLHRPKAIFAVNAMTVFIGIIFTAAVPVASTAVNNTLDENGFIVFSLCLGLMPSVIVWYLLGMSLRKTPLTKYLHLYGSGYTLSKHSFVIFSAVLWQRIKRISTTRRQR